jgi:hypothetical protein
VPPVVDCLTKQTDPSTGFGIAMSRVSGDWKLLMPALDIKTSSKVTGDAKVCEAVQV